MNRERLVKYAKKISELEGGKVSVKEEDGTISFNGLNQKTYDEYRRRMKKQLRDVRQSDFGEYLDIIDTEFIGRNGIKNIPDEYMFPVLDMAFNSGPGNAARTFQKVVGAEVDGIIGPKTIKKFEEFIKENDFVDAYSNQRINFLLESNSSSVQKNLDGLLNRVEKARQMSMPKQPAE